jgi:hypothetical protein
MNALAYRRDLRRQRLDAVGASMLAAGHRQAEREIKPPGVVEGSVWH